MQKIKGYFSFQNINKTPFKEKVSSLGNLTIEGKRTYFQDDIFFISTSYEYKENDAELFWLCNDRYLIMIDGPLTFDSRHVTDDMRKMGYKEKIAYIIEQYGQHNLNIFNVLDGSFFISIYDRQKKSIVLITDRLSSRLFLFTKNQNGFFFSNDIRSLLLNQEIKPDLDYQSVSEFIRFSMILEDRTLIASIKTIKPGCIFEISRSNEKQEFYWTINYDETWSKTSDYYREELSKAFAKATIGLITEQTTGLMISGGLDSRLIAASAKVSERELVSISFGGFQNDEVKLAKRVSNICKFPFNFIERNPNYYSNNFQNATEISQGLYSFIHAHMIGLGEQITNLGIDSLLNGWGLDLLFSGSYFPKKYLSILPGRKYPTIWPRELDNDDEIFQSIFQSLNTVSDNSLLYVMSKDCNKLNIDFPKLTLHSLINKSSNWASDRLNRHDSILFHNFSKFRSYIFPLSVRSYVKERCPIYNNHLIDIYLQLPPKFRACSRTYRGVLKSMSKELALLPYSRTGVSILMPEFIQYLGYFIQPTIHKWRLRNRDISRKNESSYAETFDSYPKFDRLFQRTLMGELASNVLSDGPIYDIGLFDKNKLLNMIDRQRNGLINSGEFLCNLMSLNKWLELIS
jgi:asparagine synthase (glutamine-hydrolysing)